MLLCIRFEIISLVGVFMEKFVEQTLLFDFYGELLNEHQRSIYEDAVFNDMSLSEIADEHGISRQGVHDLIKRVNKALEGYENKLHLVDKFLNAKNKLHKIDELSKEYIQSKDLECITQIQLIAKDIIDNF